MAAERDWWQRPTDQDDRPDRDDSWLDEDFDFEDERATVSSLWGRYAPRSYSPSESRYSQDLLRIVAAQRLVQGFVDAFATGDSHRYVVTFDESIKTAGTDFRGKRVVVSHRPLLDQTIDPALGETVMTAMAVHEADHVRYGRLTAQAVDRAYPVGHPQRELALRVSNILDDVRIERRHAEDFPGYADIFDPAIDYVFESSHDRKADPARLRGADFISGSVRYTRHVEWTPETETERDWWLAWSDRGSSKDSPKHHVAAVREGIAHLAAQFPPDAPDQDDDEPTDDQLAAMADQGESDESDDEQRSDSSAPTDETSDDESDASGSSSDETDSDQDDDDAGVSAGSTPASDDESADDESGSSDQDSSDAPTDGLEDHDDSELPSDCWSDQVDAAAVGNDPDASHISDSDAQSMVAQGQALDLESHGEVYWSPAGIARSKKPVAPVGAAAIRAAFAQSRTGNFAKQRDLRSGRLDNRSLSRVASSDFRLFERRTAQSEGKYRVWLLVDCSGSMGGRPIEKATEVATALAAATRLLPNVALDVWGWTTAWRFRNFGGIRFGAVRVYAEGDPLENVGYLRSVPRGWTPDRETLLWAGKAIRKVSKPGEQPVIIIASDGAGSMTAEAVESVRKSGVEVISVAIGSGLGDASQRAWYGEHGFVSWKGSIAATAKPLGRLIGRIAAGKGAKA